MVGDYKVVYETGENLEGLETTVGNMKGITETNKTNINIINNLIKGHTPVVKQKQLIVQVDHIKTTYSKK